MHRVQRETPAGHWRDWRQAGTGCSEAACGADGRSGWRNRAFRRPVYSAGPRWWGLIHLRRGRRSRCLIAVHKTTPAGVFHKAAGFDRARSRTAGRTVTVFGSGAIRERTAVDFVLFMEGAMANAGGCWRGPPVRKNHPATAGAPGGGGRGVPSYATHPWCAIQAGWLRGRGKGCAGRGGVVAKAARSRQAAHIWRVRVACGQTWVPCSAAPR